MRNSIRRTVYRSLTKNPRTTRVLGASFLLMMLIAPFASVRFVGAFDGRGGTSDAITVGSGQIIAARYNRQAESNASRTSSTLSQPIFMGLNLTVNTLGDAADVTLDGNCDSDAGMAGNQCTLRPAIKEANNASGADTIGFDPLLDRDTNLHARRERKRHGNDHDCVDGQWRWNGHVSFADICHHGYGGQRRAGCSGRCAYECG